MSNSCSEKNVKELQHLIYGCGDEFSSEQIIRVVVSIIDSNEQVKFLTDYFVTLSDNYDKTVGSISLQDKEFFCRWSELMEKWADAHSVIRVRTVRFFKNAQITQSVLARDFIRTIVHEGLD